MNTNCPVCGNNSVKLVKASDHHYGNKGEWTFDRCTNPDCTHIFQNPILNNEEVSGFYPQDYYAFGPSHKYQFTGYFSKQPRLYLLFCYFKYYRNYQHLNVPHNFFLASVGKLFIKKTLNIESPFYVKDGAAVDFGSGSGDFVNYLEILGWNSCGIEISAKASEQGQKAGLKILNGSSELLDDFKDHFNFVHSSHSLEHVPDARNVVHKIFSSLKKDGIIAIDVPNGDSLAFSIYKSSYFYLGAPVHINIFTVRSMRKLLSETGFKKIRIKTYSVWHSQARSVASMLFNPDSDYNFFQYKGPKLWIGYLLSFPGYCFSMIGRKGDCLVVTAVK